MPDGLLGAFPSGIERPTNGAADTAWRFVSSGVAMVEGFVL
jgi:hypothetical protein